MRKKLIEVAIPLDEINRAAAREKSIRHGHPSTLHLWWARRPLAACRAVLFCSLIDDPGQDGVPQELLDRVDRLPLPDPLPPDWSTRPLADQRRERLFAFIARLVQWENSTNEELLATARELIHAATGGSPPPVLDPFCGGGSIPLEAQRLGLEAHASDLNPVAVLITKALIEIPPKFADQPPVNPADRARGMGAAWKGAAGLAADVRYYGRWMRDEAERRIGHLYPKARLPDGGEATVIAWLWARTVTCPNPACGARMPLVRSFDLSTKPGKRAWVEPVVDRAAKTVRFDVRTGSGVPQPGTVERTGARCIVCASSVPLDHIRAEGRAGRMSEQLMAIVAEGRGSRTYLAPTASAVTPVPMPAWVPDGDLPRNPRDFKTPNYGMRSFADLFTPRQLVALTTFGDLVAEARERARRDAAAAGRADDGVPLADCGTGAAAYADAVAVYLALIVSGLADRLSTICSWDAGGPTWGTKTRNTFARQAIPMTWDFAEVMPFSGQSGSVDNALDYTAETVAGLSTGDVPSDAYQMNAASLLVGRGSMVATDPPYYDNIGYADLSDFFYVWLRRSLRSIYPDLFGTVLTPKDDEMIASPYRHGGSKLKARSFFEDRLAAAFERMRAVQSPDYPLTLFYAFKQSESEAGEDDAGGSPVASTGWETMLTGLLNAGLQVDGTWPMRSELGNRMLATGTNALASSILLACRPRPEDAPTATRREFLAALRRELPPALKVMRRENIAPVDLAQAAIGPGMAVYSRYRQVQEPNGQPLPVRTALALINQILDEALGDGDYDPETRW
ncbi:MAG TPA: DUF1156 domain-containing protein, partial [Chloroflexota bacterium]|nr:DUF1156 domain-containing protein [Chloroflexota bacterium]